MGDAELTRRDLGGGHVGSTSSATETGEPTMRAWVPALAGQDPSVMLGYVDRPYAEADEVVVDVRAYSINRGETLLLERPRPGWRPGKDVSGVVARSARDGSGPPAGTRVLGHPPSGGWAEQVAVPVRDLAVLPRTVDFITAAALPLAGLTALRMLRHAGSLMGTRLLVTGASGGVGHYVVELASAAGAQVTALSSTSERGERLRALGASDVYPEVPLHGPRYDVIMESVGGATFQRALSRLRPEGLLLWFGQASRTPVTLDFFDFFEGPAQATIRQFDYTRGDLGYGADLAALLELVDSGRLHPELGLVRAWSDTQPAIQALRARQVRGNAVLVLDPIDYTPQQEET